ncbi:MAG: hypothetical protein KME30_02585 [Iphinoe sp. HA4291-MV1]|jgi:vancomycin resistance protein VanW|nr:hypothetical protein [Iphinoe sp. HA4291-MV1]
MVVASFWGTEPKPVEVKIATTVLEKLPPLSIHGMSGWRVETVCSVRPKEFLNTEWQVNYHTLDVYKPHVKLRQNLSHIIV